MQRGPHPDHIDSDQHVDGVIARDALEHAVGGIVTRFPGNILWEWHFVHTEGALGRGKGAQVRVGLDVGRGGIQTTSGQLLWEGLKLLDRGEGQGFWKEWLGQW